MTRHLGEDAEAYALGLLDAGERAEIDRHVAECAVCLRRLGEAEASAARLAALLPQTAPSEALRARLMSSTSGRVVPLARRSPGPLRNWGFAIAAAFALAAGTSWYQIGVLQQRLTVDQLAVATLVHSHFRHVGMTNTSAAAGLSAKVVYARDGSWLYVLVDGASGALDVNATIDGKVWSCGRAMRQGETATLFVHPPRKPQAVELTRDGAIVARATLIY